MVKRAAWTTGQVALLRELYPNTPTQEIAKRLGRTDRAVYGQANLLGLKKTPTFLASGMAGRLDGIRGGETRFQKGNAAWNKGMKGLDIGGKATRFKPGSVPANHKPVGATRITKDGYVEVKVAEGMHQWRLLHREAWKQHRGQYPPAGTALIFKDGNKQNCDIGNLELVSRVDLMKRNSVHNLPKEVAELVQLRGALNRQINKRNNE